MLATRRPLGRLTAPVLRRGLIAQAAQPLVAPRPLTSSLSASSPEAKANAEAMGATVKSLEELRAKAREGGGAKTLERWRAKGKGKLSTRERCVQVVISRRSRLTG